MTRTTQSIRAEVLEMYEGGMAVKDIATELDVSEPTVYRFLKTLAVAREPSGWNEAVAHTAEIVDGYEAGVSAAALASRFNTTVYCVNKLLAQETDKLATCEVRTQARADREKLVVAAYQAGHRIVDIAVQQSISQAHIYTILARHGIRPGRRGVGVGGNDVVNS